MKPVLPDAHAVLAQPVRLNGEGFTLAVRPFRAIGGIASRSHTLDVMHQFMNENASGDNIGSRIETFVEIDHPVRRIPCIDSARAATHTALQFRRIKRYNPRRVDGWLTHQRHNANKKFRGNFGKPVHDGQQYMVGFGPGRE